MTQVDVAAGKESSRRVFNSRKGGNTSEGYLPNDVIGNTVIVLRL